MGSPSLRLMRPIAERRACTSLAPAKQGSHSPSTPWALLTSQATPADATLLSRCLTRSPPFPFQVHCEAVSALHALVRGSFDNQLSLAQLPDAFLHLRSSLVGLGSFWHPCKRDLHALLNILSR